MKTFIDFILKTLLCFVQSLDLVLSNECGAVGEISQVVPGKRSAGARILPLLDFVDGRTIHKKIPIDAVLKGFVVRMKGYVNATWSSGAPVADAGGIFKALVEDISVTASSETVKQLTPDQLKYLVDLRSSKASDPLLLVNSKKLGAGAVRGEFAWGTTGQDVAFSESRYVSFENNLTRSQALTYFDSSAHLQSTIDINCKNILAELEGSASTAVGFAIADSQIEFEIHLITSDGDLGTPFRTFRQTYLDVTFDGANTAKLVDVKREALIMGMTLEFTHRTTATGAVRPVTHEESNLILTGMKKNGKEIIKDKISLANLIEENFNKLPQTVYHDGKAYYNFLQNADLSTAIEAYLTTTLELDVSLDNSLDFATGTYGLRIHFNEIIR